MNNHLSELITWYLEMGKHEKRLSPHTIKAYQIDLNQFLCFVNDRQVNKELLSQYIKYLNSHFSPRAAKRKLASVHRSLGQSVLSIFTKTFGNSNY